MPLLVKSRRSPRMNGRSQVGVFLDGDSHLGQSWHCLVGRRQSARYVEQHLCHRRSSGRHRAQVTVFTRNDWRGSAAVHLDSWWDQAELVTLGDAPTAQPTARKRRPQPRLNRRLQLNRRPPPQPLPGGGLVHTVVAGDTLFALVAAIQCAARSDLCFERVKLVNRFCRSARQIIIKPGTGTQVPAAQPTAAPAQPTAQRAAHRSCR